MMSPVTGPANALAQPTKVGSTGSPNFSCSVDGVESSSNTLELLDHSPAAYLARNLDFTMHQLPLEELFNAIENEFATIEAATMNPRAYNFTTSNANPTKNRYINVLANEETIFPPPPAARAGKSPATSASAGWVAAGQRLLGALRGGVSPRDGDGDGGGEECTAVSGPSAAGCFTKRQPQWYINANVLDMNVAPVFVASQAPVPDCMDGFLAVLYHAEMPLVLMLTELEEAGFLKADRYWPADNVPVGRTETFGGMCVYKDAQDPYRYDATHELVRRPFFIRPTAAPRARPHKVVMYQYVGWPDRGVPDSTESFEELLRIVREHVKSAAPAIGTKDGASASASPAAPGLAPVLVHCSAGIGRTGTLIAAYTAVKLMEAGQLRNSSIRTIVSDMRKARFGMVQRVEQYMFLYMIVLQHMGIDTRGFSASMQPRADQYNMRWMEARQRALLAARAARR